MHHPLLTKLPVLQVANEISKTGRKACTALGDVSSLADVESIISTSVEQLGPLNTMVANAGIAQVKRLLDMTEEDMRRMFEVNTFGVFNSYLSAAKEMVKQGSGGKIIGAARYIQMNCHLNTI
jgi:NAD(P)-dependent dehydrogenase (short-subunit alcohol dehydrogenase family)